MQWGKASNTCDDLIAFDASAKAIMDKYSADQRYGVFAASIGVMKAVAAEHEGRLSSKVARHLDFTLSCCLFLFLYLLIIVWGC